MLEEQIDEAYVQFQKSLAKKNTLGIKLYLRLMQCHIGPAHTDISERYIIKLFKQKPVLKYEQKAELLLKYWDEERRHFWWVRNDDGQESDELPQTLAYPANVIQGALMAAEFVQDEDERQRFVDDAIAAADYIMKVQATLRRSLVPTLVQRDKRGQPLAFQDLSPEQKDVFGEDTFGENTEYIQDAFGQGWLVQDPGNGYLYRDNALAGLALAALYEYTDDDDYIIAARLAGEWARSQNWVYNFYQNGYNAWLLARLYTLTEHAPYLEDAIHIAKFGVLSGQYETSIDIGQWVVPHSNRLVFRMIMIRQLLAVLEVMPVYHKYYADLKNGTMNALKAAEKQQLDSKGFQPSEEAVMTYCDLDRSSFGEVYDYKDILPNSLNVFFLGNMLSGNNQYRLSPEGLSCLIYMNR